METKDNPVLLLAAAGHGRRMGGSQNKQYLPLAGKPILAHTLETFLALNLFSKVLVIVAPGEKSVFHKQVLLPFFPDNQFMLTVQGGEERQSSIYKGLIALQQEAFLKAEDVVCVHDGARPLVTAALILNTYKEALSSGAAIPGVPLKDTIKKVDKKFNVLETPLREHFVAVQTPQCFKFSLLWQAHQKAKGERFPGSDDASLVERLGVNVKVVPGSYENIKITTPIDLMLAEAYLAARSFKKDDLQNNCSGD